jgi:hypothetical protein
MSANDIRRGLYASLRRHELLQLVLPSGVKPLQEVDRLYMKALINMATTDKLSVWMFEFHRKGYCRGAFSVTTALLVRETTLISFAFSTKYFRGFWAFLYYLPKYVIGVHRRGSKP